jgi:hypothetical protein
MADRCRAVEVSGGLRANTACTFGTRDGIDRPDYIWDRPRARSVSPIGGSASVCAIQQRDQTRRRCDREQAIEANRLDWADFLEEEPDAGLRNIGLGSLAAVSSTRWRRCSCRTWLRAQMRKWHAQGDFSQPPVCGGSLRETVASTTSKYLILLVEPGGIEPPTSCMPCKRSPS